MDGTATASEGELLGIDEELLDSAGDPQYTDPELQEGFLRCKEHQY